ncbi:MAG: NYN domain-containing protein [Lachnospiraceae bacterium]|nr:NYN domain-containing protein [Lachnospiraceae bacterium]
MGLAYAKDRELEEIFRRTFGEVRRRVPVGASSLGQESAGKKQSAGGKFRQQGESGDRNASGQGDASDQRGPSRRNGVSEQRESSRRNGASEQREPSSQHNAPNRQGSTGRLPVPGSGLFEKRGAASGDLPEYLLVDGYNVIFAWEELAELARENLDSARQRLMDILCNYQGFVQCRLILVFDAYRVRGGRGEVQQYHNIHVVYTREAETADMYIEKVSHELGRKYRVTVATSDALEQLIVIGQGAVRISSRELKEEVELVTHRRLEEYMRKQTGEKNYALREAMEKERS